MKQILFILYGIIILSAGQAVLANNGNDPHYLKSAISLNDAVKNKEITSQQLKEYAQQGRISPIVLRGFNKLQTSPWFSQKELEIFEQKYYGSLAVEYLQNPLEFENKESL